MLDRINAQESSGLARNTKVWRAFLAESREVPELIMRLLAVHCTKNCDLSSIQPHTACHAIETALDNMVQYLEVGDSVEPNAYWKLRRRYRRNTSAIKDFLDNHNFYCPRNASKEHKLYLVDRFDRGLLSYGGYRQKDLEAFAKDRGLAIPRKGSKAQLIDALEDADDHTTFVRFMELPAELRTTIYELHLRTLEVPQRACQPPICLVSRQLRLEALPLYYDGRCLTIDIIYQSNRHRSGVQGPWTVALGEDSGTFLAEAAANVELSRTKKFMVYVKGFCYSTSGSVHTWTSWLIDLGAQRKVSNVALGMDQGRAFYPPLHGALEGYKTWVATVTARLTDFALIAKEASLRGLQHVDLDGLIEACDGRHL